MNILVSGEAGYLGLPTVKQFVDARNGLIVFGVFYYGHRRVINPGSLSAGIAAN